MLKFPPLPKRLSVMRLRSSVLSVVSLLVILGICFHVSGFSYSASVVGWVHTICPVGFLEVIASGGAVTPVLAVSAGVGFFIVLVLGRTLCSWVCPVSYLKGFMAKKPTRDTDAEPRKASMFACASCETSLAGDEGSKQSVSNTSADKLSLLISVGGVILSSLIAGFPIFCLVCPVGLSIGFVFMVYQALTQGSVGLGLVVFPLVVILEVVLFKKWCHWICPMGAFFRLIGGTNIRLRPRVAERKCLHASHKSCSRCSDCCPEQVNPHASRIPDCTNCGACVDNCPAQAISLSITQRLRSH